MVEKENKALDESVKLIKEYNRVLEQTKVLRTKIADLLKADKAATEAIQQAQTDIQTTQLRSLTQVETNRIAQEKYLDSLNEARKISEDQVDILKRQQAELKLAHDLNEITLDQYTEQNKNLVGQQIELEKQQKTLKTTIKSQQKISTEYNIQVGLVEEIGGVLGFASSVNETWLGKAERTSRAIWDSEAGLKGIGHGLQQTLAPANIFANVTSKVAQSTLLMATQMDSAIADFNRATGAGGQFNAVIDQTRFGSLSAGVGMQEAATATQALFENMSDFTEMSRRAQGEVVTTTALLEGLGISSEMTANNFDIMTKSLNMSVEQATETQLEFAAMAQQLGIAPAKMAADFASALPKLSAWGGQSKKIFKELAVQSKATGIAMDALLGITEQFDTFEGAAEAAGKLNAMLGGNLLNSVELLAATDSERIELLRESIQLSGKNFNEMTKFEKKAIGAAAGISDMNEATRLFGTSDAIFREHAAAMEADALSTDELRKAAEKGASAQKKFMLMIEALSGAALPLIESMQSALNAVLRFSDTVGGKMAGYLIAGTGAVYAFQKAIAFLTATKAAVLGVGKLMSAQAVAEQAQTAQTILIKTGESGAITSVTLAKEAEAVATAGSTATETINQGVQKKGLLLKARELVSRILSIGAKGTEAIATGAVTTALIAEEGALGVGAIAKGAYGTAAAAATGPTLAFGGAVNFAILPVTLIVLAIAAAIAAIAALIIYWDDIAAVVKDTTNGFFDLWDVLLVLTGPLGMMILAGKKIYENWEPIKSFFAGVAETVQELGNAFVSLFSMLKNPFGGSFDFFGNMFSGLRGLSGIDMPVIPKLAGGTTGFNGGPAMVGEKGPELVTMPRGANVITNENVEKLSTMSTQIETARAQEKVYSQPTRDTKSANRSLDISQINKPVIIKINERELARAVINILDKELKLNTVNN